MIQLSSRRMSNSFLPFFFAAFLLSVVSNSCLAVAQEKSDPDTAEKKKPDVEMLKCKVKVVDPDGFPVEDATVFCTGLRSKEEGGSHWIWSEESFGKAERIKTNADGIAVMSYPKMMGENRTTGQMTWSVEHSDFVNYREDHSVDADPAEIKLERGFRIALTAKNAATGEYLKQNLHAVTSFDGGVDWKLKKNGTFVSGVMKKQNGIMRVACFQDDKPTLFSEEIEVQPGDKSRVLIRDIELSVGCRVEGKLDDSVTRPVSNGYVIATLVKRSDPNDWSPLWWSDEAQISKDGTFVFESLPKDKSIQMIPICDGFSPAKPKLEDVLDALTINDPASVKRSLEAFPAVPQMVKLSESVVKTELFMYKAFSVTVKVVDQNGKPIEGVKVATNPNQFWFQGGSQILGSSHPTRKVWKLKKEGKDLTSFYRSRRSQYIKTTNESGVACLENVPSGKIYRISVYEKEWEMAIDPTSGDREKQAHVRDKDLTITIRLYPKGTSPTYDPSPVAEGITNWWSELGKQGK